jgi:hypothetical protein
MKRDDDLERFQDGMDKVLLISAIQKGSNLTDALAMLGIPTERYRTWFESDVEFRVKIYAAVSGTSVEALLATVDDES